MIITERIFTASLPDKQHSCCFNGTKFPQPFTSKPTRLSMGFCEKCKFDELYKAAKRA